MFFPRFFFTTLDIIPCQYFHVCHIQKTYWSSVLSQIKLLHVQDCTKLYVMVLYCDLWRDDTSNAF